MSGTILALLRPLIIVILRSSFIISIRKCVVWYIFSFPLKHTNVTIMLLLLFPAVWCFGDHVQVTDYIIARSFLGVKSSSSIASHVGRAKALAAWRHSWHNAMDEQHHLRFGWRHHSNGVTPIVVLAAADRNFLTKIASSMLALDRHSSIMDEDSATVVQETGWNMRGKML